MGLLPVPGTAVRGAEFCDDVFKFFKFCHFKAISLPSLISREPDSLLPAHLSHDPHLCLRIFKPLMV